VLSDLYRHHKTLLRVGGVTLSGIHWHSNHGVVATSTEQFTLPRLIFPSRAGSAFSENKNWSLVDNRKQDRRRESTAQQELIA
jgi:hypothetical protein